MPAKKERRDSEGVTVGLMHPTGPRRWPAWPRRASRCPTGWVVRQDHARRGLVVRPRSDASEADVITWCVRAGDRAVPGRHDGRVARRRLPSVGGHRARRATTPQLRDGLARWVAAHPSSCRRPRLAGAGRTAGRASRCAHAEGGMANETVLVDTRSGTGRAWWCACRRWSPRSPTTTSAPQAAGAERGGRRRRARAGAGRRRRATRGGSVRPSSSCRGCAGDIPGPAPVFDPYVARPGPVGQRLHARRLARHRGGGPRRAVGARRTGRRPARARACATRSSAGRPTSRGRRRVSRCPRWPRRSTGARRHVPAEREPVLLWGDVRLGNLVFDARAPGERPCSTGTWPSHRAARDGPRLALRARVHDGRRCSAAGVPGFPGPAEALERYERGAATPCADLAWHEVFALVRALAINDRHQRITGDPRRAREPDGRRSSWRRLEAAAAGRSGSPSARSGSSGASRRRADQVVEEREAHDARLGHLVAERVVGLDEAVGDLAVAGDAAVVLVLAGQAAAHRGVVDVEGLGVDDHLVALCHRHAVPEVTVGRAAVGAAVHAAAQERDLVAQALEGHRLDGAVGEDEVDLAAHAADGCRARSACGARAWPGWRCACVRRRCCRARGRPRCRSRRTRPTRRCAGAACPCSGPGRPTPSRVPQWWSRVPRWVVGTEREALAVDLDPALLAAEAVVAGDGAHGAAADDHAGAQLAEDGPLRVEPGDVVGDRPAGRARLSASSRRRHRRNGSTTSKLKGPSVHVHAVGAQRSVGPDGGVACRAR